MSNLYPINGDATPNEMRESLRQLSENMDVIMESQEIMAKIIRKKYLSLIKEGFTEAQALELCE